MQRNKVILLHPLFAAIPAGYLGVASGFGAVLIVSLYINNPDLVAAYPSPIWLWFVPGLMLDRVSRLWMKTHRREMHDDPVVFTARDWQSLTVVALGGPCFVLAAIPNPWTFQ